MKPDAPNQAGSFLRSRGMMLIACAVATIGIVGYFAQARALAVLTVFLTDAMVAAFWVIAAGGLGAFVLKRTRADCDRGLFVVTSLGLGLGFFSLILLGLGLAGALNPVTVWALIGVSVGLGLYEVIHASQSLPVPILQCDLSQWFLREARMEWLWLLVVPGLAIAITGASILPGFLWKPDDPHPYDVLIYHLQVPREWYELGRIVPLAHNVYSYFPFNIEMHYLGLMHLQGGPWSAMYSSQFLSLIFAGLFVATMALHCGVVAGVLSAVLPWVVMSSCVAYVESGLLMFAGLAVVWAVRGLRTRAVLPLLLAGIFCGLASGVKLTALPMLAGALGIGVFAACPRRAMLRPLLAFALATFLVVAPWLARNWAWSGNPVFPLALKVLGHGGFSPVQVDRFTRAHQAPASRAGAAGRLGAAVDEVGLNWKYGYVLWPLAMIAAVINRRKPETRALLVSLLLILLIWLIATHLISRFFVLAIPIAVVLFGSLDPVPRLFRMAQIISLPAVVIFCLLCGVLPEFSYFLSLAQEGLYGISDDLSFLDPDSLEPWRASGQAIYKIGDSQAFLMKAAPGVVKYRSPFDVDDGQGDALQAWLGAGVDRRKVWMLIDPPELRRLHDTYATPIPDLARNRARPFLVRPGELH